MLKKIFYSDVKDGKLQPNITRKILASLAPHEGKRVEITIQRQKSLRSQKQNALWWVYMDILGKELGLEKEEIHELMKFKFLRREKVIPKTGEIMEELISTTELSKTDFGVLVDSMVRWAAQSQNIILPLPDEQTSFEIS